MKSLCNKILNRFFRTSIGRLLLRGKEYECPICRYKGPFLSVHPPTGKRLHAQCPKCGASERQRLQYLVLTRLEKTSKLREMKVLHFAPEKFFKDWFIRKAASYESADLRMEGVDHHVDITSLPFLDNSYDLVFASHVLEHVHDDKAAIGEIARILAPGGMAILPVPIVVEDTIEYQEPNAYEAYHVRAPGIDYFDRYRSHFHQVKIISSDDFDEKYQTYTYENRSSPNKIMFPHRTPMAGVRHLDYVPVCIK